MTAKVSIVSAIVEVANDYKGNPKLDMVAVQDWLWQTSFNRHAVLDAIQGYDDTVTVPAFGYSETHKHGDYEPPYGVTRIFGYTLVLDGKADPLTLFGTYEIIPRILRVDLCGMAIPTTRAYHEAAKITPDFLPAAEVKS